MTAIGAALIFSLLRRQREAAAGATARRFTPMLDLGRSHRPVQLRAFYQQTRAQPNELKS
jgi:hypothetical protein